MDAHAHLFHPTWYPPRFCEQLIAGLGSKGNSSARAGQVLLRALSDNSGEPSLRAMDRAGIDRRIVLIVDWGLELGESQVSIAGVHEAVLGICRRSHDRLIGFAGIDPRRPGAAELLMWAIDDLGARGLKLHPTSSGWSLRDERTLRLIEIVASRGLIVLVHIGATFPGLVDHNADPAALLALAARYPEVTFIAGHAGFRRWSEFATQRPLAANVLLDVSGWQSLDDGTESFALELLELLQRFPGQVIFGTDSPFFGLPGSGAETRWLARLREIVVRVGPIAVTSFFEHPRLNDAHLRSGS